MRRPARALHLVLAAGLLAAVPVGGAAQVADATADTAARAPRPPYRPPRLEISLTAGTIGLGDLQTQAVLAERVDVEGLPTETLRRTLSAEEGRHLSGSVVLGLGATWAIRAGASVGWGSLGQSYAGTEVWAEDAGGLRPTAAADVSILAAEAALRFRMRSARRAQPYAELGAGVLRVEAEDRSFPGAASLAGDPSLAALVAAGLIVPIRGVLAARIQATGQFLRTPAALAPEGALIAEGDTLRLRFAAPATADFADAARELTRSLRLEVGLSVELGRASRPRAEPAGRPSGSRP